ncbi:hypothetical protein [Blastococcus sp. PRF04-17]|uniref:hypothetical protein n=1 Tax=Blastococcus sp. PRF04-17 TaxID=2933797 RepID=UPI001FF5A8BD|nr:hypothetical protein [Blastococcus sp. PRF04-17]UOY01120.1 hypothetical protein MVA48_19515 [Blastococcus sp. PRF04-17]
MSARDARSGPARDRSAARTARRSAAASRAGAAGSRAARSRAGAAATAKAPSGDGLVVGPVPGAARLTGVLLVLAGVLGAAALFPTYLVVGGEALSAANGSAGVVAGLLVPVAAVAVGAVLLRGAVPKFGLAYAGIAGALALGQMLIELYRGRSSTSRPAVEVLAGERVLTSSVEVAAGWVLAVLALGLTVVAGIVATVAWGRTVMEDGGALDPARSALAGAAVVLGVGTVLCLALPSADVPDRLVLDPATGLEVVVAQEGPQALLERPGLALLGGLLLAGAVVLCSVVAPSLRPRLAAVGALLAVAVTVLAAGLTGLRDATTSDALDWTLPGVGLLIAGVGYALLTLAAWRVRRAS